MQKAILFFGVSLILLQIILAYVDGYLVPEQISNIGGNYIYSLFEHGGFWSDVCILTPLVWYLSSKYNYTYVSSFGLVVLSILTIIWILITNTYAHSGFNEAYVHDGKTTPAGWIHAVYAILASWFVAMFYASKTKPNVFVADIFLVTILLTIFFVIGITKFTHWSFTPGAEIQLCIEISAIWIAAVTKYNHIKKAEHQR